MDICQGENIFAIREENLLFLMYSEVMSSQVTLVALKLLYFSF